MFPSLILAIAAGILCGAFTGITPGIHINLVAALLVSGSSFFLSLTHPLVLCTFIIAMSVTHTFLDVLPSVFLGAPDSATALGVLPGHRYLLRGMGLMAVKLTVLGSFGSLLMSIFLFPLFIPVVRYGYPLMRELLFWLLLAVAVFMILSDRKRAWALLVFALAGGLGFFVLRSGIKEPLLPLLSGLFGVSTLCVSLHEKNRIPAQYDAPRIKIKKRVAMQALVSGSFSGFITAILPGLGASTAAVMSLQVTRKLGDHGFMVLMGAVGTANFVLSLVALLVLDKARNGSIVAVQKLFPEHVTLPVILLFLSAALVAGGVGVLLTLGAGRAFARLIGRVDYQRLVVSIILFIFFITLLISGWRGVAVLVASTLIGLIPAVVKTRRTHAMACLLVPVMVYFWPL